jgi:hypothetical protein
MRARTKAVLLLLWVVAASVGVLLGQKKPVIPFPKGYRHWTLVKTMVIFSNQHALFDRFGGLHNVYVNDLGLPSLQQGKAYPDGAVFVFDLYDVRSGQGAIETRDRKFIGVMKKNAKLYSETGGWGWEVFQGYEANGSLKDMKPCFDCHTRQKRADYVYSTYTP